MRGVRKMTNEYTRKNADVKAIQWQSEIDNLNEIKEFTDATQVYISQPNPHTRPSLFLFLIKQGGLVYIDDGDYIIKENDTGDIRWMSAEKFKKLYEKKEVKI